MSNIAAKTNSNVSVKGYSDLSTHMEIKQVTKNETQKKLLRRGIYWTDKIEDVIAFVRKKFPGLSDDEVMYMVERWTVYC